MTEIEIYEKLYPGLTKYVDHYKGRYYEVS